MTISISSLVIGGGFLFLAGIVWGVGIMCIVSVDLCQYFEHKKLKGYADFFNSSSSFCCGVI